MRGVRPLIAIALAIAGVAFLPLGTPGAADCSVAWDAGASRDARLEFRIDHGVPTIRELAIRARGGEWRTLVANAQQSRRGASFAPRTRS